MIISTGHKMTGCDLPTLVDNSSNNQSTKHDSTERLVLGHELIDPSSPFTKDWTLLSNSEYPKLMPKPIATRIPSK